MLEIIGMIVVGFIVWNIVKKVISGGIKGNLSRAVDFSTTKGVPRGFSMEMIKRSDLIKEARNTIVKNDPSIAELDVYEQYGLALLAMYEVGKSSSV